MLADTLGPRKLCRSAPSRAPLAVFALAARGIRRRWPHLLASFGSRVLAILKVSAVWLRDAASRRSRLTMFAGHLGAYDRRRTARVVSLGRRGGGVVALAVCRSAGLRHVCASDRPEDRVLHGLLRRWRRGGFQLAAGIADVLANRDGPDSSSTSVSR